MKKLKAFIAFVKLMKRVHQSGRSKEFLDELKKLKPIQRAMVPAFPKVTSCGTNELGIGMALILFAFSLFLPLSSGFPDSLWKNAAAWLSLLCAALVTRFIPKAIEKRLPVPIASHEDLYKGVAVKRGGIIGLGVITLSLIVTLGIICGLLIFLPASISNNADPNPHLVTSLPEGVLIFIFECFACLYFFGGIGSFRQYTWKWAALALLILAPFILPGEMFKIWWPGILLIGIVFYLTGGVALYCFLTRKHTLN